jgi:methylenetetrahydrofolate dehydrogenase (NADP+)/methenyltetrahydrofolate cyclohydrolase
MPAKIIDGVALAARERTVCRQQALALKRDFGRPPGLAVIIVGDDPASAIYVQRKIRACEQVGVRSFRYAYPKNVSESEVLERITLLAEDRDVDGILVQLPLPRHFNTERVLGTIPVQKDVDGFHLYNLGGLVVGNTVFPPCTPYGVMRLLDSENINAKGQNAVVVGASNIVGKPMGLMLMQRDATISICHAQTRDLAQFTILADILVVAAGRPGLISGPMVKRGATVIDVGINRLANNRLVGDCDFASVRERAAYLTPVPGGVGPMTVTMLLVNTINSAKNALMEQARPTSLLNT